MYVYIRSEPGLWTVGFYLGDDFQPAPGGDFIAPELAAERVAYLNGGGSGSDRVADELEKIRAILARLERGSGARS